MPNHNRTEIADYLIKLDQNLGFREQLHHDFLQYLEQQSTRFAEQDYLKIDLHCHDRNSDVPDELWGRILSLPETWLKTKDLVKRLKGNSCNVLTITNHNNARSCWELIENGQDVLVAAEFTCYFPEYELFVHVLTYGFTREQEDILNEKRENIYEFLRYTAKQDIPVILPHPLYFYTRNEKIDLELFEKLAVMFQRFEVLNGQRDQWQSILTLRWTQSLTPDLIIKFAKKHNLDPTEFGVDPNQPKVLTGGSDDHMGIFAGESGSKLYVENLQQRLKTEKASELALEAIKKGDIAPYGDVAENKKLNIALLDYFSQVATRMQDPGLLRILFHRGDTSDKLACFTISNLMLEMQKHKNTQRFFEFIHSALNGCKPNKLVKWKVKKDYRFCITHLEKIADSKNRSPGEFVETVNDSVAHLFLNLNLLIVKRIKKSIKKQKEGKQKNILTPELTRKFEIPSQISQLLIGGKSNSSNISQFNLAELLDNLTFPMLVSTILLGTTVGSTRLLYQNRQFLNEFATQLGGGHHPKKALYLTDTLMDKNGVSNSLSAKLKHIQEKDLPVDFLICHSDAQPQEHLHVVRPIETFSLPEFGEQELRIPNAMEVLKIFYQGGYDRIVCSTEGPMAAISLLIKHMFNVPAYFFMHTDWIEFIKENTSLTKHERDRFRRLLRFFYSQYAGIFVLNEDHKEWLTGYEMQLEPEQVFLTAHHTNKIDLAITPVNKSELFDGANADTPIMLFAGRLSREKGVFDLIHIFKIVQMVVPSIKLVFAGVGPAEEELKQSLPEAKFLGWVERQQLQALYAGLDLKVFPSKFDTFGNVILEAYAQKMPVIAYNCKGPKSIIQHGINGLLVEDKQEMAESIIEYFTDSKLRQTLTQNCRKRCMEYQVEPIMRDFLNNMGLDYCDSTEQSDSTPQPDSSSPKDVEAA